SFARIGPIPGKVCSCSAVALFRLILAAGATGFTAVDFLALGSCLGLGTVCPVDCDRVAAQRTTASIRGAATVVFFSNRANIQPSVALIRGSTGLEWKRVWNGNRVTALSRGA